ncbi:MAG: hypothetical protein RR829_05990 [Oscillospiraceae bacterium]
MNIRDMTPEERREFSSRGGTASAIKRRRRRTFREVFAALMPEETRPIGATATAIVENYPGVLLQDAIALAIMHKAASGDVSAAAMVRDTLGEKPGSEVAEDAKPFTYEDFLHTLSDDYEY